MPRLTFHEYLKHRQFLFQQWEEQEAATFADLPLQQQLDLHDYFAPSVPLTDQQAVRHRDEITEAFPSLPQKAGRAYHAFRSAVDGSLNQIVDVYRAETTTVEMIAGKRRSLRITGIAHPVPDHYRLARALLALERHDTDGMLLAKERKMGRRRSH
jgi:hypothetical protein